MLDLSEETLKQLNTASAKILNQTSNLSILENIYLPFLNNSFPEEDVEEEFKSGYIQIKNDTHNVISKLSNHLVIYKEEINTCKVQNLDLYEMTKGIVKSLT
jgi:hypothetical protein